MAGQLTAPPVLSTPDIHILTEGLPDAVRTGATETLSEEELEVRYEISRTVGEIRKQRWRRVALQFPDHMLPHSARVYQLLARGLPQERTGNVNGSTTLDTAVSDLAISEEKPVKLTILGDTSYGSCCVDEIAAEHVDADAVVHYGRACLSPTARLPVLHIYTTMTLDYEDVVEKFQQSFPDLDTKVILTADVPYAAHVQPVCDMLQGLGYNHMFAASIIHDPSSPIPNRTLPASVSKDSASLSQWSLFHISDPPTALLLTLTSCMASVRVYSTDHSASNASTSAALENSTRLLLRRRYALVTSLTTVPIWGILINTLSVKNYMNMLSHIQRQFSAAGKKSYLFVVGKLNPAKIANFSEIGGWVVVGCWESSLVDSKGFYRPIITPFELDLALQSDETRVWTGEWRADFQAVLEDAVKRQQQMQTQVNDTDEALQSDQNGEGEHGLDSESESEPPEFDLRTGRYVSRSRPMQRTGHHQVAAGSSINGNLSTALTKRTKGDMISVNGIASPAAEYLKEKRGWRGLGSDFEVKYEEEAEADLIEEGRTGVARGYTTGESART
ncbi:Diphthamide biosynthesis protein 2 [Exophiala xenobiotica]|nr:Diphthamide biosynthesis protein 2 [Exophiala xenobiotica]KAK5252533.1 Diphthamide biosynthesis protein 2 [Exophiala xenobiotica]KAK5348318.1 Diphthamide biosynthesis protein 2 [Exophiala xenobiotica]KAK5362816.1 Diphthamide biosynthesis protein 2 [Exophiala xenobiotica]KAK5366123.1 Diphthamide biosynthesis protein 2 [Exophiala xenobiotica]